MNEQARVTDWQEVHARLEQARQVIESGGELSPEEGARILRDRALALAKPLRDATSSTETIELLVFTLGGERYGIETTHVLEAMSWQELIPVPCTPSFVLGVINYRGQILTVLDLRRLLKVPGRGVTEGGRIISVGAGGRSVGILAETVAGTISIPAYKVAPPPEALSGLRLALTRGVTEEFMTVLDLDALARTPEIVVNDEVS